MSARRPTPGGGRPARRGRGPAPERRLPERRPRGERREGLGGDQVEGRHAVRELLAAGRRRVRTVWLSNAAEPSPLLDEIAELAGRTLRLTSPERIASLARTEAPQGVVAFAEPIPEADLAELLDDPGAFLVALDGVTDPGNFGAVLRSAETAGATGVIVPRHRAAAVTPSVTKAAAGAVEHVPIALVSGIPAALERASRAQVWSVGLDGDASVSLYDLDVVDQPILLVLGAEGRGLARLTRERCDVLARIPMHGHVESLNVAAAAAVTCHEVARRRG